MTYFFWMIFSFFLISNTLFSQITNDFFDGEDKKSIASKPHLISETQEENIVDINEEKYDLSTEEIAELDLVFEYSPKRAQVIVNHLQDPHYLPHNRDYRSAYFVGDPGSGKTSMARAIGYKMSKEGWDYKFIESTQLLGEYRNQTAKQLKKELEEVVVSKRPTIVVIDELHRLLENTESKHHDTDTAATALWLFLDKQRNNKNFFLIGTMNRITKLPKPFKDRIFIDVIKFPRINDAKVKNVLFRQAIISHNMSFDNAVTNEFLDTELAKLGFCTGRNIHKLSKLLFQMQRIDNDGQVLPDVIKKENITKSIGLYMELQNDMDYDFVEETDDERQNRHHIENMNLQKQHHQENQRLQDQHFVQQQLMQVISSQYRLDPVAILRAESHLDNIYNGMSNQQVELFSKVKKESVARDKK
jgi:AAA+ superfamily predicted ATPase